MVATPWTPPGAALPCAGCGASVRVDAAWCSQCFLPAPAPATAPPVAAASRVVRGADEVRPVPGWPCSVCGTANTLADADCASCGAGFLAPVRDSDRPRLVLPLVGDLAGLGRGQRVLAGGGVVALVALLPVLLALLGH